MVSSRVAESTISVVRLQDVHFAWPGSRGFGLSIELFTLPRGRHTLLHGASGSGKSTLLALIGGLLVPDAGRIEVLGSALDSMSATERDRFRAAHVGIVFQQFNLLAYLSMIENVLLPVRFLAHGGRRRPSNDDAAQLLERLGLPAAMHGEDVRRLSIGEQQRVAVARALITAPALVLADEPTSALDDAARDTFLELLFAEAGRHGTTVLFVSHDKAIAGHFDHRLEIADLVNHR